MSIQAVAWVLEHETTTKLRDRLVLLALANHASSDDWECWPSITTLARESNLAKPDTVRAALKNLEAAGLITKVVKGAPDGRIKPDRKPNLYRILRPQAQSSDPPSQGRRSGTTPPHRGTTPPHREERPPMPGVNDPPSQGRETVSDPSLEPSLEPAAAEAAAEPSLLPGLPVRQETTTAMAQRLASAHWDSLNPKPLVPFLAVRARVKEALDAGWSEAQVADALPKLHAYSRGALDFILRQGQKQRPGKSAAALNDGRDLSTGQVKL